MMMTFKNKYAPFHDLCDLNDLSDLLELFSHPRILKAYEGFFWVLYYFYAMKCDVMQFNSM